VAANVALARQFLPWHFQNASNTHEVRTHSCIHVLRITPAWHLLVLDELVSKTHRQADFLRIRRFEDGQDSHAE
jgi:hypothetical protein